MMTRPPSSSSTRSLVASLSFWLVACSTGLGDEYGRPPVDEDEDSGESGATSSESDGTESSGADDVADTGTGEDEDPDDGSDGSGETDDSGTGTSDSGDGSSSDDSSGDTEDSGDSGDTGDDSASDTGGETEDSGDDSDTGGDSSGDDTGGDTGDSSDGDDGDSTEDSGGGDDGPEPCQISTNEVTPIPPNIMLVLDKSGSMAQETWDHDQDVGTPEVTRWSTLHGAVSRLTTNFQDRVKFGAKLFPEFGAGGFEPAACVVAAGVEVACALGNSAAIIAGIPAADAVVQGGTPMESGLNEGITYLQSLPPDEPRVALLVADGAISCTGEDFNAAVTLVTDAAASEIPTYVVGIDPSVDDPSSNQDTINQLNALAQAGGTTNPNGPPDFFPVENEADLDAVMEHIISQSLQCVVDIDPEPDFPNLFEVWVGGTQVPLITDCATESGWRWTVQHTQIEFCNQACIDLNTVGSMEGKYFCPPT